MLLLENIGFDCSTMMFTFIVVCILAFKFSDFVDFNSQVLLQFPSSFKKVVNTLGNK